ncbi:MAG: hypothetical protein LBQ54_16160 [Planctomycetaceae bacterium]|nr:hypothetical protein [Planctomycetaceae bacterium]
MLNPEQSTYFPYKNPPALSPWLELQRSTQGSNLDSYHQYVKPQMEIEKAMETQQRQLLRQKEAQLQMKQELKERGIQLKYSGTASQTGIQTRFREYGHYYPKKGMVK